MRTLKMVFILAVLAVGVGLHSEVLPAEREGPTPEFNTDLMQATFRLQGQGSQGTAFFVGKPSPINPTRHYYILVTADHVLEDMKGEFAILMLRRKVEPAQWQPLPLKIKIRDGERKRWTKHPEVDIAAMHIGIPKDANIKFITLDFLADDNLLAKYEVHPGDELNCLGYPLGVGSPQGEFPVLRSGKVASYPLLPTKEIKTFMLDFPVFGGNSGGPVYIDYSGARIYGGAMNINASFRFLVGLVSQKHEVIQTIDEPYGRRQQHYSLGLAHVIHASFIREIIELLPSPAE